LLNSNTLVALPTLTIDLTEIEEPMFTNAKILVDDPILPKLRTLMLDANVTDSITDNFKHEPVADNPKTLKLLPHFANLRILKLLPNVIISTMLIALPKEADDLMLNVEPKVS
jgi:hypothetical protein